VTGDGDGAAENMDDEDADAEDELHAALYADAEEVGKGGSAAGDESGGGKGDGLLRLGGRGVHTERPGGMGSSGLIMKVGARQPIHTFEKTEGCECEIQATHTCVAIMSHTLIHWLRGSSQASFALELRIAERGFGVPSHARLL
jgi:hypothetical protein